MAESIYATGKGAIRIGETIRSHPAGIFCDGGMIRRARTFGVFKPCPEKQSRFVFFPSRAGYFLEGTTRRMLSKCVFPSRGTEKVISSNRIQALAGLLEGGTQIDLGKRA